MFEKRASGILVHPTSFPSPYGIGDLGEGAYAFIDFLHKAKQSLWQVLPLGPTSFGDSPYQSFSSFAGNHYLISPCELVKQGWLTEEDVMEKPVFNPRRIDYGLVIEYKMGLLRKAYNNYKTKAAPAQKTRISRFYNQNKDWLDNYALFVSIKNHFIQERKHDLGSPEMENYINANKKYLTEDQIKDYYYGAVWSSWPSALAWREQGAVSEMAVKLSDEINFIKFLQYEFFRQWGLLKVYANKKGISIIGDIPIFVAMDSSDVWADPDLYCLDSEGRTTIMAGCPPDYFAETGQLWRNPVYEWNAHKKTEYEWWIRRVAAVLKTADMMRIDHFRGFESYWAVPFGEKTAVNGKWLKGPGKALFNAIERKLGHLPIIAEDLGIITEKVEKLRTGLNLPGMKVLHFAFNPEDKSEYLPHHITDGHTVIYTGTHDNDTTLGWYENALEIEKDYLRRYMNVSGEDVAWDLIRLALSTSAIYAIVPIQDVMNLGTEDRMNLPGVAAGYWQFRYTEDMLTEEQAERLAYLTELFHRTPEEAKV